MLTEGVMVDLEVSRRSFMGLISAAAVAGFKIPAFAPPRAPYVSDADGSVSYVGMWKPENKDSFIGGRVIKEVRDWDGFGYPVILDIGGYDKVQKDVVLYDVELCNFNRELTEVFGTHVAPWTRPQLQRYPNLHSWVRHRRLGEPPEAMIARMEAMRLGLPHPDFASR